MFVYILYPIGEYELLSLKTAFYTGFICRVCGCDHKGMQTKLKVSDFQCFGSENVNEYNSDVQKAIENRRKREEKELELGKPLSTYMIRKHYTITSKFGVVNECIFTRLPGVTVFNIGSFYVKFSRC